MMSKKASRYGSPNSRYEQMRGAVTSLFYPWDRETLPIESYFEEEGPRR